MYAYIKQLFAWLLQHRELSFEKTATGYQTVTKPHTKLNTKKSKPFYLIRNVLGFTSTTLPSFSVFPPAEVFSSGVIIPREPEVTPSALLFVAEGGA